MREGKTKGNRVRSVRARRCGVAFPHISYTAGDVEEPYAVPGGKGRTAIYRYWEEFGGGL